MGLNPNYILAFICLYMFMGFLFSVVVYWADDDMNQPFFVVTMGLIFMVSGMTLYFEVKKQLIKENRRYGSHRIPFWWKSP